MPVAQTGEYYWCLKWQKTWSIPRKFMNV